MTRSQIIRDNLNLLAKQGYVSEWWCSMPGDRLRWLVTWQDRSGQRAGERAYSTYELELVFHAVFTVTNDDWRWNL